MLTNPRAVDKTTAHYFDFLFGHGDSYSGGSYTLFGWIALRVIPTGPERELLPLARAALAAWRSAKPGHARVGVPPQVVYSFASATASCNLQRLRFYSTTFLRVRQRFSGCGGVIWWRLCPPCPLTGEFFSAIQISRKQRKLGRLTMLFLQTVCAERLAMQFCNTLAGLC